MNNKRSLQNTKALSKLVDQKKYAVYKLSTALNLNPTFKLEKSAIELGTIKCKFGRAKDAVEADAIVFAFAERRVHILMDPTAHLDLALLLYPNRFFRCQPGLSQPKTTLDGVQRF
jgi:hypothetical protein